MELNQNTNISPFLRWTGSKRWFVKEHILKFLPNKFRNYHEPFLGGGAVFFFIKQQLPQESRAFFLSDSNSELINTYEQIKSDPNRIISHLKKLKNTKEDYYKIRDYNPRAEYRKAAKFIYLNRTSFNGIYRVNSNGVYNVPYGFRSNVDVVCENQLRQISKLLYNVKFSTASFENTLANVQDGDLVFLDPPYTVSHDANGFIEYNQKLFSWRDQEKLKNIVMQIIEKKAFFILTNASHSSIVSLYKDIAQVTTLSRPSIVGGRIKTRGIYNELIVNNF